MASRTINIPPSPESGHYEAIGRLVAACSGLEVALHATLRHLLAIDESAARLLIGERRMGELCALVRSVAIQKNFTLERQNWLGELLQYVDGLNKVRAVVAHKPFFAAGTALRFHNVVTAKSEAAIWEYECTEGQLRNAEALATELISSLLATCFDPLWTTPGALEAMKVRVASAIKSDQPPRPDPRRPLSAD